MHTTLIDPATFASHLGDPLWVVIDCRFDLTDTAKGEREFAAGHIPGARYADLDRHLSAGKTGTNGRHPMPSPAEMRARFGALGIGPRCQVVAYDADNGIYAARLWWMLRYMSHDAVAVLNGGFARWTAEGRATESDPPVNAPAAFQGEPRAGWLLTVHDVAEIVRTRSSSAPSAAPAASVQSAPSSAPASSASSAAPASSVLVDARSPERFLGIGETLDRVGGHIPGARNFFYQRSLALDKTLKPADDLRWQWDEVLKGRDPRSVVMYCGSGVTACHNLLSMEVAGLSGGRIFAGSWSEWSADPSLPVAIDTD